MIGKKEKTAEEKKPVADALLADLPRGEVERTSRSSRLPEGRFEKQNDLAKRPFKAGTREVLLGVVDGHAELVTRGEGWTEPVVYGGTLVGSLDDRHLVTIAGSRAGKGRSVIIPNLLSYGGSTLVIDPKGENAQITAAHRAKELGQQVHILDPFKITGEAVAQYRAQYNPLKLLTDTNPYLVEDAGLLADALIVPGGGDRHWDETARDFIEGVILHVCTYHTYSAAEVNLQTVSNLVSGKRGSIADLVREMLQNERADLQVMAAARAFDEKPDKEKGSVLSTVRRNLRFLSYEAMQEATTGHDFALSSLKQDRVTVYLCLPAMRMGTCSQWLRLFVNQTLSAVERDATRPDIPILLMLDEFAVLGHLNEIEQAAGQIAGLGVKLWPFLQDLGQLKALYKERWETFLGNAGVLQFFGNSDLTTLEWISKRLGKTNIEVVQQGALSLRQRNEGSTGRSVNQTVTDLLTLEEVSRYFGRGDRYARQLIIEAGEFPKVLQRLNYDQHEAFAGKYAPRA